MMLAEFLRRVVCSHSATETITTPEAGPGWVGERRARHCLDCGKHMRP